MDCILYDETVESSDVELVRALLAAQRGAFDRFVGIYHAKLFRYSFAMCGQREDAEEVAQETLLKIFESLPTLREPEQLKPWLYRIAKNACLMKRRRSLFAPHPNEEVSLDELRPGRDGSSQRLEIADWSALPEKLASDSEVRGAIEDAVRDLPDLYRAVFLLRDVEGLSTEEAAHALEVNTDVIKTRLHRARLMMRKHLDAHLRGAVKGVGRL